VPTNPRGTTDDDPPRETTALNRTAELLPANGFDGLTSAVTVLLNEGMMIERANAPGAGPYERSEGRPFRLGTGWVAVLVTWVATKTPADFGSFRGR